MMPALSSNTQAILLLTSPLIAGRGPIESDLLKPAEYKRLAQRLREIQCEPSDLLTEKSMECLPACNSVINEDRLRKLLARGFQLSQVVERWQARAIWVVSRADPDYPRRLKARLRDNAPAILYGCGEVHLLNDGGLAVVGSRHIDEALSDYTMSVGRLVASANRTVISGGAKGIDQAAMRGALEAGGRVCGVLADSLEKQAMTREHRNMLLDGQLTLISPYDPNAGFNVGNAMQRNKLIYALADASLVVSSDVDKGGTWTGAVEQLEKLNFVPVFVRSTGQASQGLEKLRAKGAHSWPNPESAEALESILATPRKGSPQGGLSFFGEGDAVADLLPQTSEPKIPPPEASTSLVAPIADTKAQSPSQRREVGVGPTDEVSKIGPDPDEGAPAEQLFAAARKSIERILIAPMRSAEVAQALQISPKQASDWLDRLVTAGVLEKGRKRPVYMIKQQQLL